MMFSTQLCFHLLVTQLGQVRVQKQLRIPFQSEMKRISTYYSHKKIKSIEQDRQSIILYFYCQSLLIFLVSRKFTQIEQFLILLTIYLNVSRATSMNFYFFLNSNPHTVVPQGISYPFQHPYFLPVPPSPLSYPHHPPSGIFGNYNSLSNSTNILQNSEQGMLRLSTDVQIDKAPRQVGIRRKREKNIERQTVSAKKNSESNLINHFFIFFTTRECSSREVVRIVSSIGKEKGSNIQTKVSIFYNLMKMINLNRGKKYMNKQILMSFFTEEGLTLNIPQTVNKIQKMEIFKLQELVDMLRISFYFFIRETSLTSILTSKRISLLSKQIHLGRRIKIINDFDNKIY